MKNHEFLNDLACRIQQLHAEGLYKTERIITSPQQASICVQGALPVINFCSNNYLGLANHPQLIQAAKEALDVYGYGLSSVRFICGTQSVHKALERQISGFLKTDDTILYSSCFDANGGLFETLLSEEDAVISDGLNHASIIDGIRLCKAKRFRYQNNDMHDLEQQLQATVDARYRLIVTDGVFSMDGVVANLEGICELADRYRALVMVDDSHAVGFMGEHGRGTPEHCGVEGRVDIITGTLGKALGGASGGYTSGRKEIIEWLRQRSRTYLFSNTLMPSIAAASLKAFELIGQDDTLREKCHENSRYFRKGIQDLGFKVIPGSHPIVPVMLGDAKLALQMAHELLAESIYVVGFSFPVVPHGQARIRVQLSAAHERSHLDQALAAFKKVGEKLDVIEHKEQ